TASGAACNDDFNAGWRTSGVALGQVDLQNGIFRVVESYYRGTFSTVKTRTSERQIPMSPLVLVALRKWRDLRPGGPDDLVFATRNKKALSDGNLLKRYIYPACDAAKIPRVSWHMFRHLYGTLLSQLGVPASLTAGRHHRDNHIISWSRTSFGTYSLGPTFLKVDEKSSLNHPLPAAQPACDYHGLTLN